MVNGLLVPATVFQKVGIVVVDFGIVRQGLDTGAETKKRRDMSRDEDMTEFREVQFHLI